jgi:signal transduction histidine kinase
MAYLAIKNIFSATETRESKTKIVLLAVGLCSMLFSLFFTWNPLIFGYPDGVDQFGFVGAIIFLSVITYMVVKFKMFGMKLLATQALVWGLVILIGSQFFFIKVPVNFVLNGIGFLVAIILGQFLIKAVKKEIEAKENERLQHIKFEELANRFENINHILAHDVKNTLGKNRDIFAETLAGTFGQITDQGKNFFKRLNADTADVITSVNNLLKSGDRMKPDPKPFDFKQALLDVVVSTKDKADEKKIKIETQIDENEDYTINADRSLLVPHVLKNLIENAVAYGVKDGSVWINLSKKDSKTILLTVKDNGVGMTEEDKKVLYKPGGHGADSIKFNVHTTGFGLLIAKETMDAHNGKVYGISEGRGKGSTFFVELPIDFTTMPMLSEASKI